MTIIIIKNLFSFKLENDDNSKTINELRNEFQKKDILALLGFFVLIPTLTVVLSVVLAWLSDSIVSYDKELIYLIKPNMGTWIIMAIMSSLGVSVYIIFGIMKLIFKDRVNQYWIYYNRKYGFKATSLLKYVAILVVFSSSTLICAQLNSYVKFKSDKIEINRFTDLVGNEYSFTSIDEIVHYQKTVAPNGKIVNKPHYEIIFNDKTFWRTNDDLRTPNKTDDEIFMFLAEKTNIEIEQKEVDE